MRTGQGKVKLEGMWAVRTRCQICRVAAQQGKSKNESRREAGPAFPGREYMRIAGDRIRRLVEKAGKVRWWQPRSVASYEDDAPECLAAGSCRRMG